MIHDDSDSHTRNRHLFESFVLTVPSYFQFEVVPHCIKYWAWFPLFRAWNKKEQLSYSNSKNWRSDRKYICKMKQGRSRSRSRARSLAESPLILGGSDKQILTAFISQRPKLNWRGVVLLRMDACFLVVVAGPCGAGSLGSSSLGSYS